MVDAAAELGEGPVWDERAGVLHWVNITAGQVLTTSIETGETTTVTLPTMVGAVAPAASGGLVAAVAEGFAFDSCTTTLRVLGPSERMNDAKVDPYGRFWAGSTARDFTPGRGALHVLMPDRTSTVALTGLTLPNGLGWSPDGLRMYLVDTLQYRLYSFAFGADGLDPHDRQVLHQFDTAEGMPDGLCVDAEGCLWVAIWGGHKLVRYSPSGQALTTVDLPVEQPSSCTFGGPAWDRLFVTSARQGLNAAPPDLNGALLEILTPAVPGHPTSPFGG
nr:SMP-30/gluconolactonase/LRE family protein [Kribbella shirazensis]